MATSAADIVAAIDAAILNMMNGGGAQSLSVGGRSVTYTSLDALVKARAVYAQMAASGAASDKLPFKIFHTKPKGMN